MPRKDLTIINKLGLHARAAAKLVATASRFGCRISIGRDSKSADAKSIMGVMMLAASKGTAIWLETEGEEENEALLSLETLINNRFDEDE